MFELNEMRVIELFSIYGCLLAPFENLLDHKSRVRSTAHVDQAEVDFASQVNGSEPIIETLHELLKEMIKLRDLRFLDNNLETLAVKRGEKWY